MGAAAVVPQACRYAEATRVHATHCCERLIAHHSFKHAAWYVCPHCSASASSCRSSSSGSLQMMHGSLASLAPLAGASDSLVVSILLFAAAAGSVNELASSVPVMMGNKSKPLELLGRAGRAFLIRGR